MSNVLAIAQKELKAYFASPIAYIVIGFFAFLYARFYTIFLFSFEQQSSQMMGFDGGPVMNINEMMIGPLLLNVSVLLLFTLPIITMRTLAEEKRSGTIELLLTAPITDLQIILGKFAGAMGLYVAMLAVTVPHVVLLFAYGEPEWIPIATGYLGVLLMGGCFIAVGLLVSSLTRNQIVAAFVTFAVFLFLWVVNWMTPSGPTLAHIVNFLAITDRLQDFTMGILDTRHLVYYLSFIAFGLFLTLRSLDMERWRG
jgi:ABC-2 type transport system permease protein